MSKFREWRYEPYRGPSTRITRDMVDGISIYHGCKRKYKDWGSAKLPTCRINRINVNLDVHKCSYCKATIPDRIMFQVKLLLGR